jgi:site-specific DNA-methyltransferase (adenine-specific)
LSKETLGSLELNSVIHGECLEVMKEIKTASVDMVLCDLPYGTTACKWDTIIPFDPLWEQYERIIKDNGAIVLTASQPFTSALVMSNPKLFKYSWVWDKKNPTNFVLAKKQPLKYHEDICVFYKKQCVYNPIKWKGKPNHTRGKGGEYQSKIYPNKIKTPEDDTSGLKFPKSILEFPKHASQCKLHPSQKPMELFEYLIKTYTNEGMTVLDNCAGSGTTAIACLELAAKGEPRNYILIEREKEYIDIINKRIAEYKESLIIEKEENELHNDLNNS